ncbi:hypothetical protein ACFVZ8_13060 [Streptomyces sp. NPDC059558]|uniref:hypothetical protein n=1 Tax=unclassified Streptomyces TaxID=2593676 RepID=UPI0009C35206|nr:hypothetical protein [Streptomyces sp. Sge12]ARE73410.1 hypothetical protein B6R96_05260 [Streptomyces sp. Sge12]
MFRKRLGAQAPALPIPEAAPVARLPITNDGRNRLSLVLEPWGSEEWVEPGEKVTVITIGTADGDRPWSGTRSPHEPFEVQYCADMLVVWANGSVTIVEDSEGNELSRW